MAFQSEIINSVKGPSIIRVADVGTATIALVDLRATPNTETVANASIKRVTWSTNGSIQITRNSIPILMLHNAGEMRFDDFGYSLANNSNQSIAITVNTGGSLVMEVSKTATYNVDPYTGQTV
jgi:hypothetical protein